MHLLNRSGSVARTIGRGLLLAAPRLMKALTVIGTAAMFLVGGGIVTHRVPDVHHGVAHAAELGGGVPPIGGGGAASTPLVLDGLVGMARRQPDTHGLQGTWRRPFGIQRRREEVGSQPSVTRRGARTAARGGHRRTGSQ